MEKDLFKNIDLGKEILPHYNLLKDIGVLDYIESLKQEIENKEKLLDEFINLFNQTTVTELIDYLTTQMLNKLVPNNLVFVIQVEYTPDDSEIFQYNNLKRIDTDIKIPSLKPFKNYFSRYPDLISYEEFRKEIKNKNVSDLFALIYPEFIVPLMGLGGMYGFLVLGKKVIAKQYSEQEINYVSRIMKCASVCLQNHVHYLRAIIDYKTHLYSPHFFKKRLNEELSRIIRYETQIAVLLIDLDYFKKINDTFGHLAGDRILLEIGKIIEGNIRKSDVAARFGGEEFIIMLLECNKEKAFKVAEKIRVIIESNIIEYMGKKINITISCGISVVSIDHFYEADEIIRQADCALYFSKNQGRNHTSFYSLDIEDENSV